jgi:hypothetical protein
MTRYVGAADLAGVVSGAGAVPGSAGLAATLRSMGSDLVTINAVDTADLLPTYEVRLARAADVEERVDGLGEFVTALRSESGSVEQFSVRSPVRRYVGLLDRGGHTLLALVVVHVEGGMS